MGLRTNISVLAIAAIRGSAAISSCLEQYVLCGGRNSGVADNCCHGLVCVWKSQWYSQCDEPVGYADIDACKDTARLSFLVDGIDRRDPENQVRCFAGTSVDSQTGDRVLCHIGEGVGFKCASVWLARN